jgi:hypothetical protein
MNVRLLAVLVLAATGCSVGPRLSNFAPATSALGVEAAVVTRVTQPRAATYTISGELLSLSPTGVLLLRFAGGDLILITPASFVRGDFKHLGNFRTLPAAFNSSRIRLASRFPQGTTVELASRLLDAHKQELIVVGAAGERKVSREQLGEFFPSSTPGLDAARDSFVAAARAGSERYRDRTLAIRDGYRRVGTEFPFMGEHWVNPALLIAGTPSAQRPSVLSYARVGDASMLVGVGYAVAGTPPVDFAPADAIWHEHAGTVADALLAQHGAASMSQQGEPPFSVLHAWAWTANPDGLFTTDNLALPFLRARLTAPAHIERNAAQALALFAGGDAFYIDVIRAAAQGTVEEQEIERAVASARERVQEWRAAFTDNERPDVVQLARLAAIWENMATTILSAVPASAATRLRPQLLGTHH